MCIEPNNARGILSITGGGYRGIMPAWAINFFKREYHVDPKEIFDFYAGTSIGAPIALGLAKPGDQTPQDIYDNLCKTMPLVFKRPSWWDTLTTLDFTFKNEYGATPLQNSLDAQFGNTLFSSARKPVLIMATKTVPFSPFKFVSNEANQFPNLTMSQVIRASSAAPVYLPGYSIQDNQGTNVEFVDGGMSGANNPVMRAITHFSKEIPLDEEVVVMSLGTGQCPLDLPTSSAHWGPVQYVAGKNQPLITGLFNTMVENADQGALEWSQGKSVKPRMFYAINPEIPAKYDALNDATPEAMKEIIECEKLWCEKHKDEIEIPIRRLAR